MYRVAPLSRPPIRGPRGADPAIRDALIALIRNPWRFCATVGIEMQNSGRSKERRQHRTLRSRDDSTIHTVMITPTLKELLWWFWEYVLFLSDPWWRELGLTSVSVRTRGSHSIYVMTENTKPSGTRSLCLCHNFSFHYISHKTTALHQPITW